MLIRYFSHLSGHIAKKASKGRAPDLKKIVYNGGKDTTQQKKVCVIREI